MYQIDNSTASPTQPPSTSQGAPGYFTDGSIGGGVQPTIVPAEWLNAVQQELINVLAFAGITPVKNTFNQIALAIASKIRTRLNSNLVVYVSPSGVDAHGNGFSAGNPFNTISYAYSYIQSNYDLNGFNLTIQLANGTYGQAILNGKIAGQIGGGSITINGSATPGAVVIQPSANGQGIIAVIGTAIITLSGLTINSGSFTGCTGVFCYPFSTVIFGPNVTFGAIPGGSHIQNQQGQVQLYNYAITGGATNHLVSSQGNITLQGVGTITGEPAFTNFALAQNIGAIIAFNTASYAGAVTGNRYTCTMNGIINTQGGGASFFPGSVAGSVSTGGQYV